MALRGTWRLFVLFVAVLQGLALFFPVWVLARGCPSRRERSEWLHRSCERILRRLALNVEVTGPLPCAGLVASNHLSHLDILLFSSVMPCIFISKVEVKSWPFFGWAASFGGTVFLDRGNSVSAAAAAQVVEELLREDIPVVLFAEGTTTDGTTVQQFRSSFFEPAVRANAPVTAAAVAYLVATGHPESEVCFYGEEAFGSNLVKTLRQPSLNARLAFMATPHVYQNRKQAASSAWHQAVALRENPGTSFDSQSESEPRLPRIIGRGWRPWSE